MQDICLGLGMWFVAASQLVAGIRPKSWWVITLVILLSGAALGLFVGKLFWNLEIDLPLPPTAAFLFNFTGALANCVLGYLSYIGDRKAPAH